MKAFPKKAVVIISSLIFSNFLGAQTERAEIEDHRQIAPGVYEIRDAKSDRFLITGPDAAPIVRQGLRVQALRLLEEKGADGWKQARELLRALAMWEDLSPHPLEKNSFGRTCTAETRHVASLNGGATYFANENCPLEEDQYEIDYSGTWDSGDAHGCADIIHHDRSHEEYSCVTITGEGVFQSYKTPLPGFPCFNCADRTVIHDFLYGYECFERGGGGSEAVKTYQVGVDIECCGDGDGQCSEQETCWHGDCVECRDRASDCGAGYCHQGSCVECLIQQHCGAGQSCVQNECVLAPPPLLVSATGPQNLQSGERATWTCDVSGGASPYQRTWFKTSATGIQVMGHGVTLKTSHESSFNLVCDVVDQTHQFGTDYVSVYIAGSGGGPFPH